MIPTRRRGMMTVEAIVAAVILGIALSMLLPGMAAVRRQRHAHQRELHSRIELNNQLASLTPVRAIAQSEPGWEFETAPVLSDWYSKRYPEQQLSVEFLNLPDEGPGRSLIPVRLSIRPAAAEMSALVSVVTWVRKPESVP